MRYLGKGSNIVQVHLQNVCAFYVTSKFMSLQVGNIPGKYPITQGVSSICNVLLVMLDVCTVYAYTHPRKGICKFYTFITMRYVLRLGAIFV